MSADCSRPRERWSWAVSSSGERSAGLGDPMTAPFWAAAERHQFILQRCAACGAHQFYPRPFCLVCGSAEVAWVPSAGRGTIYAQTTVHVPVIPELEPPYVVALVQLDEGPRLMTNLIDVEPSPDDIVCDMPVEVAWQDATDEITLPLFRPAK